MNNNIRPKKSLGQNFLTSESALQKIVDSADIKRNELVLEVGPGKGALTQKILEKGGKIVAIEKDDRLIPFLNERFKKDIENGNLIIKNEDILDFPTQKSCFDEEKYKIVANIPYYITGHFIKKFLTIGNKPEKMIILIQKEVAERIVAKDGKESILSMSVKAYGLPKFIDTVKKGSFFPSPKVDSAILSIDLFGQEISKFKNKEEEVRFFEILHAGFGQKRKMILGNLENVFESKERTLDAVGKCNIDPKKRAEVLKLEDWICLSKK